MSTVADSGKLTSADDVMILEDEKARMVLRSTDDLIGRVTTGACPSRRARDRRAH